jgi:hypothetical protein
MFSLDGAVASRRVYEEEPKKERYSTKDEEREVAIGVGKEEGTTEF